MHIFVVHPGASFATHDVYLGVVGGLRANGVTVSEGRLDSILAWYQAAIGRGVAAGRFRPDLLERSAMVNQGGEDGFNLSVYASAPITRGILLAEPDWVVVVSGTAFNVHDVRILRKAGIRVALLCTESPYFADWEVQIGQFYDVVFTHERACVAPYRAAGLNAHYLPHAYNPAVHTASGEVLEPCDVRFVGSLFDERKALLLGAWDGIDARIGGLDPDAAHAEMVQQITDNARLAALYRGASVNLNHHRTSRQHGSKQHIAVGEAESLGPRAYEIAACGGFQLMDDSRSEALEVFGEALATYRAGDPADLRRQVRYWLDHPHERAVMAAAQHGAVQPHSWHRRVGELLERLEDHWRCTLSLASARANANLARAEQEAADARSTLAEALRGA